MQSNSSKVSVRRATEDDATFLSWILLEASRSSLPRGFYDVLFDDCGEGELLAILKDLVLTHEPSFTRWDCFLIAEIDGIHAGGNHPRATSARRKLTTLWGRSRVRLQR